MQTGVPIHTDKILRKIFAYDLKLSGRASHVADNDDYTLDPDDDNASILSALSLVCEWSLRGYMCVSIE